MTTAAVEPTTLRHDVRVSGGRPGLVRLLATVLLSMLAAFGAVVTPAPAELSAASGAIEESQSASPQTSVESVADATARPQRRRRVRTASWIRRRRTPRRWLLRSWALPVRFAGGVPPGRAPPSFAASL